MNPRVVLKLLLQRLEPRVGHIGPADFCAFDGEDVDLKANAETGNLHFAEAALEARDALASGSEQRIIEAAMICASLERTGLEVARRNLAKKGGRRRGADQARAAAAVWQPYVRQYGEILAKGVASTKARRMVTTKMAKDRFTLPGGGFPDARTIRKWLPAPTTNRRNAD